MEEVPVVIMREIHTERRMREKEKEKGGGLWVFARERWSPGGKSKKKESDEKKDCTA